jgi:hypothetical protein
MNMTLRNRHLQQKARITGAVSASLLLHPLEECSHPAVYIMKQGQVYRYFPNRSIGSGGGMTLQDIWYAEAWLKTTAKMKVLRTLFLVIR